MMKKLLLLAFIAVACEAMAQDAQWVPESAAMVEVIRLFDVRSGFGGLGRSRKFHLMWHISPASSSCSTGERPSSRPDLRTTLGQRAQ